jgi:hypothetical protein
MGKPIAHVQPLIPAHAEDIGWLIDAIEQDSRFEVVADPDERGSFTVERKVKEHGQEGRPEEEARALEP